MPRALVIDSDQATRHLLRDLLDLHGYQVHVTADPEAGVAAFQQHRPDCVLIDLRTPAPDSIELLRALRSSPGGRRALIVMLSTDSERAGWLAWDGGPDTYLTKPFDTQQLLSYIQTHITPEPPDLQGLVVPKPKNAIIRHRTRLKALNGESGHELRQASHMTT